LAEIESKTALDLFFSATHCNVVINAHLDNLNPDFSAFVLDNKQDEGIVHLFHSDPDTITAVFSQNRSQTDSR
jgi:hypothetical protein